MGSGTRQTPTAGRGNGRLEVDASARAPQPDPAVAARARPRQQTRGSRVAPTAERPPATGVNGPTTETKKMNGLSVPGRLQRKTRRSSLKEWGRSRVLGGSFLASSCSCGRAEVRRWGQGSGGARPRSGRRALRPAPSGACCGRAEKGSWGCSWSRSGSMASRSSGPGSRWVGSPVGGCLSSLRRAGGGMTGFAVRLAGGVNQKGRPRRWGS